MSGAGRARTDDDRIMRSESPERYASLYKCTHFWSKFGRLEQYRNSKNCRTFRETNISTGHKKRRLHISEKPR